MATIYQTTDVTAPGTALTVSNDTLVLVKDKNIASTNGGYGIFISYAQNQIVVGPTLNIFGNVYGDYGIFQYSGVGAVNLYVGASGTITGASVGIYIQSASFKGYNYGEISAVGGDAVILSSASSFPFLQNSFSNFGTITGNTSGLSIGSYGTTIASNYGTISGTFAVLGSAGSELFSNFGTLRGEVLLGGGNDTFVVGVGSQVTGKIDSGSGSDTISFANFDKGVRVDLPSGLTWDGQTTLRAVNFENAVGTSFSDFFIGNEADNTFDVGAGGADVMYGYGGADTISYATSGRGVRVDMPSGASFDGLNTTYFYDVENVIGSRGNDIIIGNGLDNVLDGGPGGLDQILGGAGIDTLSYASSELSVRVDMPSGISWDGVNTDYFVGIENLVGSNLNDTLIGDDNANVFTGGRGGDTITTNGGADKVVMPSLDEINVFGYDVVTDFNVSLDKLIFYSSSFSSSASFVSGAGAAAVPGSTTPTFLYNTTTGMLSYDSDGTGATVASPIVSLSNKPALTSANLTFI